MKLHWGDGPDFYTTSGESLTFRVVANPSGGWIVSKYRRDVHLRTAQVFTLQGAFARAQVWENDDNE